MAIISEDNEGVLVGKDEGEPVGDSVVGDSVGWIVGDEVGPIVMFIAVGGAKTNRRDLETDKNSKSLNPSLGVQAQA